MKIIILGANGFIGRRILKRLNQQQIHTIMACSLHSDIQPEDGYQFKTIDILDFNTVNIVLNEFQPNIIINASALSIVDYCEQHPEEAYAINVSAVEYLAEYCQQHTCRLIHFSTDFVFDGSISRPYTENDITNPVNYYGKTKQWGEEKIKEKCISYAIIRVEVVYGRPLPGQHGNIVQLVKNRLENGQSIQVVSDQFRTPTWVEDIAIATEKLLPNKYEGIYHICGNEILSVADIAYQIANHFKLDTSLIKTVTTKEMNEKTPRPLYSPMNTEKAYKEFGYLPHSLKNALISWDMEFSS